MSLPHRRQRRRRLRLRLLLQLRPPRRLRLQHQLQLQLRLQLRLQPPLALPPLLHQRPHRRQRPLRPLRPPLRQPPCRKACHRRATSGSSGRKKVEGRRFMTFGGLTLTVLWYARMPFPTLAGARARAHVCVLLSGSVFALRSRIVSGFRHSPSCLPRSARGKSQSASSHIRYVLCCAVMRVVDISTRRADATQNSTTLERSSSSWSARR
jgi:hypothetical protein